MELTLSIFAILLSFASFGWAIYFGRVNLYQTKLNRNLSLMSDLKMKLGDMPEAFRFYGISEEDIKKHGLTPLELAYLTSNFLAGQVFWETEITRNKKYFSDNDYRARLCQSDEIQKAWPLISKMMDDTPYKDHLDNLILKYSKT